MRHQNRDKQRGVATLEFALVFSLLFFVFWGIISYTFPLIVLQTMNRAVAEGARVAAEESPSQTQFVTLATAAANEEIEQQLAWLPAGWRAPITQIVRFDPAAECPPVRPNCLLTVELRYPNYTGNPIVPSLNLPGLGPVPRLPNDLIARVNLLL